MTPEYRRAPLAPPGEDPEIEYSWGKQNWLPWSAAEQRATRTAVAVFDQTSFSKYLVAGPDADPQAERRRGVHGVPPVGPGDGEYGGRAAPAAGGAGPDVAVSTTAQCTWTATSNAPWISITSGASGTGTGAVRFAVAFALVLVALVVHVRIVALLRQNARRSFQSIGMPLAV